VVLRELLAVLLEEQAAIHLLEQLLHLVVAVAGMELTILALQQRVTPEALEVVGGLALTQVLAVDQVMLEVILL